MTDTTKIRRLRELGQSIWLDYIRRDLVEGGELAGLVEEGVGGVTSNPSIFRKAIAQSDLYDGQLRELLERNGEADTVELYEALALRDIRNAADVLRPVYDRTGGADGFVSVEVSPDLAHDTDGTVEEARRLWRSTDRPNVMIKVPATKAGIPAIERLIGEGVNVNVTLMFSLAHHDVVSGAYLRGLDALDDPSGVASVASFFVSRVDTKVDARLDEIGGEEAEALRGTIAIANTRLAYDRYRQVFHGPRFEGFRAKGARPQRVLFGSTSTKDERYSDVKYVDGLIGPETVNTVPPHTLEAFRDHGTVRETLTEDLDLARDRIERLGALGIDLGGVTETLQEEGVNAFADAFEALLASLEEKRDSVPAG